VRRIFVDETMVNAGGTPALIWVAFEPDLRAMLDFHVSWRGNSIDAYLFIGRLVRRYGGVPIYTDGAPWCADACGWAGAERVVYGRPLRNLMERMIQYAKEGTEASDDIFPVGGRAFESPRTGYQRSCPCRTSRSRRGAWGGPRLSRKRGDAAVAERAAPDLLARVGGGLKATEPRICQ